MESLAPEQQYWLIQPLLAAGVELEQIRVLVFRLAFETVTSGGRDTVMGASSVVSDQPPEAQAAWATVIGRMIAVHTPD
ncbi:hypothetical protein [Modestobacter lacusdianchii]